ncbi:MAG: hypothetical protein IJX38_05745 [Clostridia bacterium]|nr:hypothetical protein [Clostridia bacterium]
MDRIGIKKEIDNLGRIVIPIEMRRLFSIEREVEIVVIEDGILLRSPLYKLVKSSEIEKT